MVVYRNTRDGIGVMADSSFVPPDPANRDWIAFQAFVAGSGVTQDALDVPIGEERAHAKERVDAQAERQREALNVKFTRAGAALMLREAEQVVAIVAASTPMPTDGFPLLRAEMAVTSQGLVGTAQAVVAAADDAAESWAGIEAARQAAHDLIDTKGTPLAIDATVEAIDWAAPVPGGDQPV